MTCRQCKHDFCWLCMGDYKTHSSETGRGLCESFEDVQKAGRVKTKEMSDKVAIEHEMKRMEFYSGRYINHQNAVKFGENKLNEIQTQIDVVCNTQKRYGYNDF